MAQQIQDLLRSFSSSASGGVEKTSYDDFYIDVTAACQLLPSTGAPADVVCGEEPPPSLGLASAAGAVRAGGEAWRELAGDLKRGVTLAQSMQSALQQELGFTLSCGVARNKLLARLATPLGKPNGLTG